MGDVIHMLPAITDMAKVYPELEIDWLVEEGFAHIPAWHPAVKRCFVLKKTPVLLMFSVLPQPN